MSAARRCRARFASTATLALGVALARPLVAQDAPNALVAPSALVLAASADVSTVRLARDVTVSRVFAGPVLGMRGRLSFGRFGLEAGYAQGSLAAQAGTIGDGEDFADAALLLRVNVQPWLSLGGGPHLRAFITPAGTAHWTRLEARARVEGELIAGLAQAHLETWYALTVDANVQGGGGTPGGGAGAHGGEVGLTVRLPRSPLALRLTYAADRATFANGGAEFLERVGVALVLGRF